MNGGLPRRFAVGAAAALLAAGAARVADAQVAPYQVIREVVPYVGLGAGAVEITPGLGDASTRAVTLPFDLTLYGETFSTLYINANGVVNVTSSRAGLNFPAFSVPASAAPNGFIAALWDDWCSSVTGCAGAVNPGVGVYYEIDDLVPGQGKITVEWRRIRHFSDTVAPSDVSFELTWYEGPASQVELHYGPASPGTDFIGGPTRMEARIGIENAAGSLGQWLAPCAASLPCPTADVQNLANTRITLLADAGEDVAVTGVSAPDVGYPGLPIPISARIVSRHQNPLGPITWAVHLLDPTSTSTVGSTPLYVSPPLSLAGFESRPVSLDLEIPPTWPRGRYRLAVVVDPDHRLAETDEANNLGLSVNSVRIAERAPDFRVGYLRPVQSSLRPGQTLELDYELENFGNEPGALEAQFYLSSNRAITTADLDLGAPIRATTASREVLQGTAQLTLPADLQTGLYYVGVLLDAALQVPELDESNNVGRTAAPLVVASNQVEILTESLPAASLGREYSVTLAAAGGDGRFSFEITSGYAPRGLRFDEATGTLAGVPLQPVTVDITFRVASGTARGNRTLTLAVLEPELPLTLVSGQLPDATLGQDYAARLFAAGGVWPYGWSVAAGGLPPGVGMSTDGDVLGTPTETGVYPITFQVRDNGGASSTVATSLTVRPTPNLSILTRDLPPATVGVGYLQTLFASGGIQPLTWRRLTVLPPGLILTTEGRIQGSPEQVGRARFVVEVTDAAGNVDTNELSLEVVDEGRFGMVTEVLPVGAPGTDYRALVRATGGEPPYTWTLVRDEGRLPASFELGPGLGVMTGETPDDLIIEGRLEREGLWPFTIRVTDTRGRAAERAFAIVSRVPPPEPPPPDEGGCVCLRHPGAGERGFFLWTGGLLALAFSRSRRRSDP